MITKLKNKPVRYIRGRLDLKMLDKVNYFLRFFDRVQDQPYMYEEGDVSVLELLNKNIKPSLEKDSVLYFTKTSKFPRLKLNNTSFKRTIKFEKADISVINEKYGLYQPLGLFFIFETEACYFALNVHHRNDYKDADQYKTDPVYYIDNYVKCISNQHPTYVGKGFIFCTRAPEIVDTLLTGKDVPLIRDITLDHDISKSYEKITKETFHEIKDMLYSSDSQVTGLGLKMLGMYDLTDVPASIYGTLRMVYSWVSSVPEWNNTIVKQVRDTVGISNKRIYKSQLSFSDIFQKTKSDLDKELCIELILEYIKKNNEKIRLAGRDVFDFKIKYEICKL